MKLFFCVTFIITLAYATAELANKDKNSTLLFSYICDEKPLQSVEEKLKFLLDENNNLRLKLDTLTSITSSNNLQLSKFETTIANLSSTIAILTTSVSQIESKNSLAASSFDQMMDLLRNISDSNSYPKSNMKSILPFPTSCAEAFQQNGQQSGTYKIYLPESKLEPFFVNCLADAEKPEAPWTVIQRRQDGSIDFYRNWTDYQKGFGNMEGEFFIGLDILHALTQSTLQELWIKMEDFENQTRSAYYSSFAIGDSSEAYALKILGSFKGDAGDSLTVHAGQKFSTQDMDNDMYDKRNCAESFKGAWWYKNCYYSNLNGRYVGNQANDEGILWVNFHMDNSLKYVHMAIRPVTKNN